MSSPSNASSESKSESDDLIFPDNDSLKRALIDLIAQVFGFNIRTVKSISDAIIELLHDNQLGFCAFQGWFCKLANCGRYHLDEKLKEHFGEDYDEDMVDNMSKACSLCVCYLHQEDKIVGPYPAERNFTKKYTVGAFKTESILRAIIYVLVVDFEIQNADQLLLNELRKNVSFRNKARSEVQRRARELVESHADKKQDWQQKRVMQQPSTAPPTDYQVVPGKPSYASVSKGDQPVRQASAFKPIKQPDQPQPQLQPQPQPQPQPVAKQDLSEIQRLRLNLAELRGLRNSFSQTPSFDEMEEIAAIDGNIAGLERRIKKLEQAQNASAPGQKFPTLTTTQPEQSEQPNKKEVVVNTTAISVIEAVF